MESNTTIGKTLRYFSKLCFDKFTSILESEFIKALFCFLYLFFGEDKLWTAAGCTNYIYFSKTV